MMSQVSNAQIIDLINREVVPALGCTEPIAVALTAARAAEVLGKTPDKISIKVSGNILKNAMAVGIPGTGMTGLPIAAALGAIGGKSGKLLKVLDDVSPEQIEMAKKFVDEERVSIDYKEDTDPLYIECEVISGNDSSLVIINHRHTNIIFISHNGEEILNKDIELEKEEKKDYPPLTVERIYQFAMEAPLEDIRFIMEGAKINEAVAQEGLHHAYGMQIGRKIQENIKKGILSPDISQIAMSLTTAAVDARMAGCTLPVMSNSGSGNQGLSVMLPVIAIAKKLNKSEEELIRALILSNLVAIHIKSFLGRLSALCGALVAATGASAAITYLMGGTYEQVLFSIKNMAGGITGMICDGAKIGCALKISASVNAAIQSALLALDNITISHYDGIIERDIEKTIRNIGEIGSTGMMETDKLILKTMICK